MNVNIGLIMQCKYLTNGIRINEDGTIVPCCTFIGDIGINYTNDFDIDEYFNLPVLKELQSQLEEDKWPKGCENCYKKELIKSPSLRQTSLIDNNGLILDVVIGKECNSDCVMCYSGQSSKITSRLLHYKPTFDVPTSDEYWTTVSNINGNWANDFNFWEKILTLFPRIERIKFLGGEPLLNKKLWNWLEHETVLQDKKNKQFELVTNASIINSEKMHLFTGWKNTSISLSIDAVGNEYEWIRQGLSWNTIKDNAKKFQELSNVYVSVHATISLYNIAVVTDLLKWVIENDLLITFTMVNSPSLLSIQYAPVNVLTNTLAELSSIKFKKMQNNVQLNGLKNAIKNAIADNKEDKNLRKSMTDYFNNHRTHKMNWETLRCMT